MLPFHPYADIFPLIEGSDFDALVADVKANGLVDPIDEFEGAILDGRNRARACDVAGIEPVVHPFLGTSEQALAYVISKNLKRRHLNESQRAYVGAKLATLSPGRPSENAANLRVSGIAGNRQTDEHVEVDGVADVFASGTITQSDAARILNVSPRSIQNAAHVKRHGTEELRRAVERGVLPVSAAARAAQLSPETQAKIADEAMAGHANVVRTVIKKERRAVREKELGERQQALPTKKYGVILADPEWRFEPYSRETGMDRAPENHYSTSETLDIITRPVGDIAADDAVLFLWATAPMLPQALAVMKAWGFEYKTHLIWHKTRNGDGRGAGYWFTGEHEPLLVGTRGKIPAPATALCGSVIAAPAGRHSEKPEEEICGLIERAFPTMPKIELNRRGPARPGWDAWGNETVPQGDPETGEVLNHKEAAE